MSSGRTNGKFPTNLIGEKHSILKTLTAWGARCRGSVPYSNR